MASYLEAYLTRPAGQAAPLADPRGNRQVANNAGGHSFAVDPWSRLDRFLILGSEGGTYYIKEKALTRDNAQNVEFRIRQDGVRVVKRVVEISQNGRAPSNDPALFVLAMVAGLGNEEARAAVWEALPKVARTGAHIVRFVGFLEQFKGWSRASRRGVGDWYNKMQAERLAYQVIKYQRRDGWGHRDALRLAHPKPATTDHDAIFQYVTKGKLAEAVTGDKRDPLRLLFAYEEIKRAQTVAEVCRLIAEYGMTWEMVPARWLGNLRVWETLLPNLPIDALLRNLGRLSALGLLSGNSSETFYAARVLAEQKRVKEGRLHPLAVLVAMRTYASGAGDKGSLRWQPARLINDALDTCFYLAFGAVAPTGKRVMLALDVSNSMAQSQISGLNINCREASAAMAMVTARVEQQYLVTAFSTGGRKVLRSGVKSREGLDVGISEIAISPRQRLEDVIAYIGGLGIGGTDCALPMLYADHRKIETDAFVIYTDSQTWAGAVHPVEALDRYRQQTGIDAKLITVGMTSNGFTIGDPADPHCLDVVGFDTAAPAAISAFIQA